jgi:hypothetical protein
MKRSLRRKIEKAINETWNPRRTNCRGEVTVVVSFPETAFPDAPHWSPGPGFETTAGAGGDYAWLRHNPDGTSTAVVTCIGPKELPAADGGEWTEPEVWTTTAPTDCAFFQSGALWDKPHRITWLLNEPDAVIHREPYAGHPAAEMDAYWEAFEKRWGFIPGRMDRGRHPFADHRRFVVLHAVPGWDNLPNEAELLRATMLLVRTFGGRPRVYGYDPERRETRGPLGAALVDPTLGIMTRRLGLSTR